MISENDLQVCISAYRNDKIDNRQMLEVFEKLADLVFNNPSYYFEHDDVNTTISGAAELCLEKLPKYDGSKGTRTKAFNFFTTIIGCYLRQTKRFISNVKKSHK
jgi:hypothetical protein